MISSVLLTNLQFGQDSACPTWLSAEEAQRLGLKYLMGHGYPYHCSYWKGSNTVRPALAFLGTFFSMSF
jgi:hypothetical protein